MKEAMVQGLAAQAKAKQTLEDLGKSLERFQQIRKEYAPLADLIEQACAKSGLGKRETVELALRHYIESI